MKIISGLFDTHEEARLAVDALEDAGIASDDISVVGPDGNTDASGAAEGAGIGAAVGGVGGLLAGLGAFAIPGIGPVIGAGWLAATLAGMAAGGLAGGLVGSLTDAGVDDQDAHIYAEGIKRGGTMVVARVDEAQVEPAEAILGQHGRVDIAERRSEYQATGWNAFDDADGVDALDRQRRPEPIVTPPLPR
jgi:uncharacterized membrane protein